MATIVYSVYLSASIFLDKKKNFYRAFTWSHKIDASVVLKELKDNTPQSALWAYKLV